MKKKIIALAAISLLSAPVHAQVYDMVRSVNTLVGLLQDTKAGDYTETGTLELNGNSMRRVRTICQSGNCLTQDIKDEILLVDPETGYRALIAGDSGALEVVTILSTFPTIIIMQSTSSGKVSIEEYKARE